MFVKCLLNVWQTEISATVLRIQTLHLSYQDENMEFCDRMLNF